MINLLDVIAHAACNSGVVPSFNLLELPPDVQQMGMEALTEELIPQMNTDRTLDVSVTSKVFHPVNREIIMSNDETVATPDAFVEWVPARVDAVMEEPSRVPYAYLYRMEFENIDYKFQPYTYTTEMGTNFLKIMFRQTNTPKRIVYPVPIYVDVKKKEIVAQPKFKQYLIDTLAAKFALIYGMSTLQVMMSAVDISYGHLVKQHPTPIRSVNPRMKIRDVLKNGQSRYWRFDGFV